ncbi:MAG: RluA family pseudouridine synthase [Bacteroidales bacterium]|jgi:23S rRNA pseudouridine1911/1915/1917 synthase|nr:RluA family pseudouridine synthase [Bacteroidales bacterium]
MSEYRNIPPEEFDELASEILYEDNHLLIINKRPGELVQGDKTGDECLAETLKAFIAQRDGKPGKVFMGVTHRIDRPTSGTVIFAKTSKALSRLNDMFRTGDIHKTYWALVCERPPLDEGDLGNYLTRNEKSNKTFVSDKPCKGSKEARMHYKLIRETERYFLLEVRLLTGRHHQIRAQLAHIGCHIKGDLKYGARRSNRNGGICLHSRSVSFIHPVKKTEINVTAPVDWSPIIKE